MSYRTPAGRVEAVHRALSVITDASRIVVTTHLNADGDGAGSEAAVVEWLRQRGAEAWIVNPTRFPETFRYLIKDPSWVLDPGSSTAQEVYASADLALILDTGEVPRIGRVRQRIEHLPKVIVDHHIPGETPIVGTSLRDEEACATGELVLDLLLAADAKITARMAEGVYVAVLTDTGSFRFSNASPGAHELAADMIRLGVDPEETHRKVYGRAPMKRYRLLATALAELEVDEESGVAWMTVPMEAYDALDASADDLDGFVDYPRSVEGAEIGLLFRTTTAGDTKVSFRSNGRVNVNQLAGEFGGGGHAKASGAVVRAPLEEARDRVLTAARAAARRARQGRG